LSRFQNFRFVLRTISIVVQFSRIISADSPTGLSTAYLLYHPSPPLSIPFLKNIHFLSTNPKLSIKQAKSRAAYSSSASHFIYKSKQKVST